MNDNRILSEQKYQRARKILIVLGIVSLVVGITLLVLAITMNVPSMSDDNWFGSSTSRIFMFMGAFLFGLMLPLVFFSLAFARNMAAFQAQSSVPVFKEVAEDVAPAAGKVAKEVAKGVKEGIDEAKKEE
ncbi:MAG: hypothetical protein IJH20_05215 [Bacilli bacterium]|nr:hypothetical protein [Bacilli bacterium]